MNRLQKETQKANKIKKEMRELLKEVDLISNGKDTPKARKRLFEIEKELQKKDFALSQYEFFVYDYYHDRPHLLESIEILKLPKNIYVQLTNKNIEDIEDLLLKSAQKLIKMGLSKKNIDTIRKYLKKHNAYLDKEYPENLDIDTFKWIN